MMHVTENKPRVNDVIVSLLVRGGSCKRHGGNGLVVWSLCSVEVAISAIIIYKVKYILKRACLLSNVYVLKGGGGGGGGGGGKTKF